MKRWISIPDVVPWLHTAQPYFVHAESEERLRKDLKAARLPAVTLQGAGLRDDFELLQRLFQCLEFPIECPNWNAFADGVGDLPVRGRRMALLWTDAQDLASNDLHAFVSSIHELLRATEGLGMAAEYQLELFLIGNTDAWRRR